jgi:hypothetical protein
MVLHGFSKVTTDKLLHLILSSLHGNFCLCSPPESFLPREDPDPFTGQGHCHTNSCSQCKQHAIQTIEHLSTESIHVTDVTKMGWIASKPNIDLVLENMLRLDANNVNTVAFLELFNNFVYRYRHCGETLSLLYKEGNTVSTTRGGGDHSPVRRFF